MLLYLIRHGQAQSNATRHYAGQQDSPLTELGREQALALRPLLAGLRFDRVYCSDLCRAGVTRELALPGVEVTETPALREYEMGSLQGRYAPDVRKHYDLSNLDYSAFGGEDRTKVKSRLRPFLEEVEQSGCECVAAFCHGGILKTMLTLVLGDELPLGRLYNGNCNIAVYEYKDGQWSLHSWNAGCLAQTLPLTREEGL